jgi:hypothetical protein
MKQRMAGLNIKPVFNATYTSQSLATNVAGGVTNFYLTNIVITASNDWSKVYWAQEPLKAMLTNLFGPDGNGRYPWGYFMATQHIESTSNVLALTAADIAEFISGYVDTNNASAVDALANHRTVSNLAVQTWAATNATLAPQTWGNYTYAGGLGFSRFGIRAISNSTMYAVYSPGSTNAGNLTLTLTGNIRSTRGAGVYTNEQFEIAPNATQALAHVFVTPPMIEDSLSGGRSSSNILITVNSGTVNTGDQVAVYLDALELWTGSVYSPFWDTRTILNTVYAVLDEMRVCVIPAWPIFIDGYMGRDTTAELAASNRVQ